LTASARLVFATGWKPAARQPPSEALVNKLFNIFKIPELAQKIGITLMFLAIYRVGYHIPLAVVDQEHMKALAQDISSGPFGQLFNFAVMFSGVNLAQLTIFGLGIMPYISASIIIQLLTSVVPSLEKLKKEGESGQKKINEITRYVTVGICILQSAMFVNFFKQASQGEKPVYNLDLYDSWYFYITTIITMTAGTIFLMWIGEQIDEYGIGNGISLLIMAGIVARLPQATRDIFFTTGEGGMQFRDKIFTLGGGTGSDPSLEILLLLVAMFLAVVVAVIAITKAQRRIPTQSARHVRGRRVYGGGARQFLPLRLNQSGVMPVIFAGSLLMIPTFIFNFIAGLSDSGVGWARRLQQDFQGHGYWYNLSYIALIYFFCYFWTAITFNPKEMSNQLRDYGSFIPGYRPGKRTAEYLEKVMFRITYVGAAFLAIVAIIPTVIANTLDVNMMVAQFYGGTSLLIAVSVALDVVNRINSHLVMRNYPGLTED
jgi:preprotein translocase subunit SecY